MYSVGSLSIAGFLGKPLPNTFFMQDGETDHVAVLLPGYGYRCFGPVLYYPTLSALSLGADVLWAEYAYDREPEYRRLRSTERREWLASDSRAAVDSALAQRPYRRVTMIGKSIGTLAMGQLLSVDARLKAAKAIWLTPLLRNEELRERLGEVGNQSLFVSGSADPQYDPEFAAVLRERSMSLLLFEGADHSLEVPGDVPRCLEIVRELADAVLGFLRG